MSILIRLLALLRQFVHAIKALPAPDHNRPGDPASYLRRRAGGIAARRGGTKGLDSSNNLVAKDGRHRFDATAGVGVEIATAQCAAQDPDKDFRAPRRRSRDTHEFERLIGAGKNDRTRHYAILPAAGLSTRCVAA